MPGGSIQLVSAGRQSRRSRKKPAAKTSKKIVSNMINASKPSKQIRYSNSANENTATVAGCMHNLSLVNIANGTQINQKIANVIKVSSVNIKMSIANSALQSRCLRIMIVRAKNPADEPNLTTYTDLYEDAAYANAAPTGLAIDATIPLNRDVWKVYYDRTFPIGAQTQMKQLYFSKKIKLNRRVTYSTLASNTASNGRIFMIYNLCNTDDVADAAGCRISYFVTTYFKDA